MVAVNWITYLYRSRSLLLLLSLAERSLDALAQVVVSRFPGKQFSIDKEGRNTPYALIQTFEQIALHGPAIGTVYQVLQELFIDDPHFPGIFTLADGSQSPPVVKERVVHFSEFTFLGCA